MYKIGVYPFEGEVLPGQHVQLKFDRRRIYCPIYRVSEGYIWCWSPSITSKPVFEGVVGNALEPPKLSKITYVRKEFYYHIFYWAQYWKRVLDCPLLIDLADPLDFGTVIPSQFVDSRYNWFSQYIAALKELEELQIPHRLISAHLEHSLTSINDLASCDSFQTLGYQQVTRSQAN